jgi:hypothetical protein
MKLLPIKPAPPVTSKVLGIGSWVLGLGSWVLVDISLLTIGISLLQGVNKTVEHLTNFIVSLNKFTKTVEDK